MRENPRFLSHAETAEFGAAANARPWHSGCFKRLRKTAPASEKIFIPETGTFPSIQKICSDKEAGAVLL
jgi:hypothetical protein